MRTETKISLADFFKISVVSGSIYKFLLIAGLIAKRAIEIYAKLQEGVKSSQEGALTPDAVEKLRLICENRDDEDVSARQIPFTLEEIVNPKDWQAYGAQLLLDTLSNHSLEIRSALNVGGYNDRHFSYMAQQFPEIKFCSVDFMSEPKMHAFNRLLPQSPNWSVRSGYALDLLRNGELECDLVFLSSTSLLFNNKELDLYLDEISSRSKIVVINEGWGIVSRTSRLSSLGLIPRVIRPEDIPVDEPVVRSMDGVYFSYAHNYPAKLEKHGFRVTLSRILSANSPHLYLYQLIAHKIDRGSPIASGSKFSARGRRVAT